MHERSGTGLVQVLPVELFMLSLVVELLQEVAPLLPHVHRVFGYAFCVGHLRGVQTLQVAGEEEAVVCHFGAQGDVLALLVLGTQGLRFGKTAEEAILVEVRPARFGDKGVLDASLAVEVSFKVMLFILFIIFVVRLAEGIIVVTVVGYGEIVSSLQNGTVWACANDCRPISSRLPIMNCAPENL